MSPTPLSYFPDEVLANLLDFLPIRTVEGTLSKLNKRWLQITNNPYICNRRQFLDLSTQSDISRIDGSVLVTLSNKYKRLHHIILSVCISVTNQGLKMLIKSNPQLHYLNVLHCTNILDATLDPYDTQMELVYPNEYIYQEGEVYYDVFKKKAYKCTKPGILGVARWMVHV